jgi:transposase
MVVRNRARDTGQEWRMNPRWKIRRSAPVTKLSKDQVMTIKILNETGESRCAIARRLGVTEGAVRYRLKRLTAPKPDGRRKQALIERLGLQAVVAEWWTRERASLEAVRGVNVELLHELLSVEHGYSGSVKSVRKYLRSRFPRPKLRPYRRIETPPGAQAQVDWSDHRIDIGDPAGPTLLHAFHLTLSHSRKEAVVWSRAMDQLSWHHAHNGALTRIGGVPAVLRIDNLKTGIGTGAGSWGEINAQYRRYAQSLGFHVDACQPRSPEQKGKVERRVRSLRAWNVANRCFESLDHLQAWTDQKGELDARRRRCPPLGTTVAEAWDHERRLLRPLPETLPEPFDLVKTVVVARDCHIAFEGRRYPVPFAHVGLPVEARGGAGVVQIIDPITGVVLRSYPRRTAARVLIDPTCFEGEATDRVLPPTPLGAMARKLDEIRQAGVELRSIELYAALAEVAR